MITLSIILGLLLAFALTAFFYMKLPMFGTLPSGKRLSRIEQSPNYKNGSFQNRSHTPDLTEGATYGSVMKEMLLGDKTNRKPTHKIPSVKTNLLNLDPAENVLVWFGHSSYFIQVDGKKILVDPVLSGAASPVAFTTRAFNGTDIYIPDDFPEIDILFISHDHWDHLDYKTIMRLKPKIKLIICGLGTGAHFEHWGFDPEKIMEADWNEELSPIEGFKINTVSARHFSGRGFKRNKALWTSFVLQTPHFKLFLGGDSGYDSHFLETGNKHGPFDLVILENGQYNKSWKYIHMKPEEVLMAAKDLGAKRLFPVHSGKFALANHTWDEPLKRITNLNLEAGLAIITPIIGAKVFLEKTEQTFTEWWKYT
jgi:L-ascorbate metabolism protein UlaG (beta-lactamase superfamily)